MFVTLRDGMAALVAALAATLPAGSVRLGARVQSLARDPVPAATPAPWRVTLAGDETLAADAVIVAVPAPAAARLLAGVDAALARELGGIAYASSAVITLAYRRDQLPSAPQAFGFVVPAAERRLVIAGSFSSVKYAGRAPADAVLLRLFLGGALQPELFRLGDDDMVHTARAEARALLGVTGEPTLTWLQRWPEAMPQYHVGHAARVAAIEGRVKLLPGLALAGNAYHGVGLADCVRSGEAAADVLLAVAAARAGARA
jgi:oxygen-dependent protoporphyrinogen oxidase